MAMVESAAPPTSPASSHSSESSKRHYFPRSFPLRKKRSLPHCSNNYFTDNSAALSRNPLPTTNAALEMKTSIRTTDDVNTSNSVNGSAIPIDVSHRKRRNEQAKKELYTISIHSDEPLPAYRLFPKDTDTRTMAMRHPGKNVLSPPINTATPDISRKFEQGKENVSRHHEDDTQSMNMFQFPFAPAPDGPLPPCPPNQAHEEQQERGRTKEKTSRCHLFSRSHSRKRAPRNLLSKSNSTSDPSFQAYLVIIEKLAAQGVPHTQWSAILAALDAAGVIAGSDYPPAPAIPEKSRLRYARAHHKSAETTTTRNSDSSSTGSTFTHTQSKSLPALPSATKYRPPSSKPVRREQFPTSKGLSDRFSVMSVEDLKQVEMLEELLQDLHLL